MRTIKFRGKDIETNQWVEGDLLQCPHKYPNIRMWEEAYPIARNIDCVVFPETVGQFTGLHDKKGKEIYEGDIVLFTNHIQDVSVIEFESGCYMCNTKNYAMQLTYSLGLHVEVIGNIHDNPELMKGGEE